MGHALQRTTKATFIDSRIRFGGVSFNYRFGTTTFSLVLAGGGLNQCGAYGITDELSATIEEHPVSVPDLHATIYATLGIDPSKVLYGQQNRPIPITDSGQSIHQLLI